jgi:hypothetical protein
LVQRGLPGPGTTQLLIGEEDSLAEPVRTKRVMVVAALSLGIDVELALFDLGLGGTFHVKKDSIDQGAGGALANI